MKITQHFYMQYPQITGEWTLFLDRDGVINKKLDGTYVMNPDQFEILPGVAEAIGVLSTMFGRIIVVTNQQGIGKELMTHENIAQIHDKMIESIAWSGGRIDEIYYCPDLAWENSPNRKPNPGMGFQAKKDFPKINFRKSIMIGDSESDIQFGKALKMITVRISNINDQQADFTHSSLKDFSIYLNN